MRTVALFSIKGSPGVTTLACCLGAVWPADRRVVIMEADPAGGDICTRFLLPDAPGLMTLALATRGANNGIIDIDQHVQVLPGGLEVLIGPPNSDAALSLDREVVALSQLISISTNDIDLIIDCGRISPALQSQMAILERADIAIMVSPLDARVVPHAEKMIARINSVRSHWQGEPPVKVVMSGNGGAKPKELAEALGIELIGSIPVDHQGAAVACGHPGNNAAFAKSHLIRASVTIASEVTHNLAMIDRSIMPDDKNTNPMPSDHPMPSDQEKDSSNMPAEMRSA